jgi:hypothetical protein
MKSDLLSVLDGEKQQRMQACVNEMAKGRATTKIESFDVARRGRQMEPSKETRAAALLLL